jgi:putative ABC transport system permease protein
VNGEAVIADNYDDPQTQRLATRVFNLSWADKVQRGNEIVEGQWWDGDTQKTNQISFDEGLARRMNLALGDELVFVSAGEEVSATITSIRKINWGTFQPNFYAILPPAALADFPATYISSFYIAAQDKAFLNQLIREFRNLTVIDVGQMINQVRGIMDQVTLVIEFVFLFTIMAGLLVMFATMQSTHDERMRDNAIMKTFGASRSQLRSILMVEFVFIGLMSSIIASFAANLTGFSISHFLMKIPYQLHISSLLLSILVGTALITIVGLLAFRQYHKQSANEVLRRV